MGIIARLRFGARQSALQPRYDLSGDVTIRAEFRDDTTNALTAVSGVAFLIIKADGTTLSPSPSVVTEAAGIYRCVVTPDIAGLWAVEVSSSTAGTTVDRREFMMVSDSLPPVAPGAADSAMILYRQSAASVTRTVQDRLRERSASPRDFISAKDGDDWAPAFEAALAASDTVFVPAETFLVARAIRMDLGGAATSKSLIGQGRASHIKKMDNSAIPTGNGRRDSVIQWTSGGDFVLSGLMIEGNLSRGGLAPPYCINWTGVGTNYTMPATGLRIVSTAPDGTLASPRTEADRIFVLLQAHTASANILTDVALGRWVEVTDQPWNELTGTGYLNSWALDNDFAWRHGIYGNGLTTATLDNIVNECFVTDTVYGGILIGKGPLFASLAGFGSVRTKIRGNLVYSTGATCIGGGGAIKRVIMDNTCRDSDSSLIRCDEGSHESTIIGNVLEGQGSATNGAISIFKSNDIQVVGNQGYDAAIGLTATNCDRLTTSSNHWESNGTGISLREVDDFNLQGDICLANDNDGFKFSRGTGSGSITNLQLRDNGRYGMDMDDAGGITISGIVARRNGNTGMRCTDIRSSSIIGCQMWDNGFGGTNPDVCGIELASCTDMTVAANRCGDTRSGVDRTQQYGIRETGVCSGIVYLSNMLKSNGTASLEAPNAAGQLLNDLTAPSLDSGTTLSFNPTTEARFRISGTMRGVLTSAGNWAFGGDIGGDTLRVLTNAAPVAFTQITAGVSGVAGGAPNIAVVAHPGGPASADLRLTPLGTAGRVRFGDFTANTGLTVAGSIEIKDAAGTVRRVMIAS